MINFDTMSPTIPPSPAPPNQVNALDVACRAVVEYRKKPLLVLYYPDRSRMTEDDLDDVYHAFRAADVTVEEKLDSLDILIDSYGGNPVAAYRLAQLIRDFTAKAVFLVADHAYSAATLLCFSGDSVRLAHYAGLSPIDITLVAASGSAPEEEVELANIDNFLEFAKKCRGMIEELLISYGGKGKTKVDSDLLVEMVKQVGALQVGKYFRERLLTGDYAQELLDKYMFATFPDRVSRRVEVIERFLFRAPSHSFHVDHHLCRNWQLIVDEMGTQESDLVKAVVEKLNGLAQEALICRRLSRQMRMSFSRFYPYARTT